MLLRSIIKKPVYTYQQFSRRFRVFPARLCGIWGYIPNPNSISSTPSNTPSINTIYNSFKCLQHRGPDSSTFKTILLKPLNDITSLNSIMSSNPKTKEIYLGFHRLSINKPGTDNDQPFTFEKENGNGNIYITCNGEIYNYKELIVKYNLKKNVNGNDCSILPQLYVKLGFKNMLKQLRGEYAISILDMNKDDTYELYIGRDPLGIRPCYIGYDSNGFAYGSELLSITNLIKNRSVRQLKGGTYILFKGYKNDMTTTKKYDVRTLNNTTKIKYHTVFNNHETKNQVNIIQNRYYNVNDIVYSNNMDLNRIEHNIETTLIKAVQRRLYSDQPMGLLLSGGFDSSIITSIASKLTTKPLRTFSIGMEGGTDEIYALKVSKMCNTIHTHIVVPVAKFIGTLPKIIKATGTYDITTIRASTGQYLISEYIKNNTDIKVLLVGDGSDECCSGYMYFHNSPNIINGHRENQRLLNDIIHFDGLRADRCIANHGLEARLPFLDRHFIDMYISIHPSLRLPFSTIFSKRSNTEHHNYTVPSYMRPYLPKSEDFKDCVNLNNNENTACSIDRLDMEKWLLRKTFSGNSMIDNKPYLPSSIVWRPKEAFSDGVSSMKNSWTDILTAHFDKSYSNDWYNRNLQKYDYNKPVSKESLYYREIFTKIYGAHSECVVPYLWMPKWSETNIEPSARKLNIYHENIEKKNKN